MASLTPNYSLILPSVNDPTDQDLWGGMLNSNFSAIDGIMQDNEDYSLGASGALDNYPLNVSGDFRSFETSRISGSTASFSNNPPTTYTNILGFLKRETFATGNIVLTYTSLNGPTVGQQYVSFYDGSVWTGWVLPQSIVPKILTLTGNITIGPEYSGSSILRETGSHTINIPDLSTIPVGSMVTITSMDTTGDITLTFASGIRGLVAGDDIYPNTGWSVIIEPLGSVTIFKQASDLWVISGTGVG